MITSDITPQIISSPAKQLVGISKSLSLANYNVQELWQRFIPISRTIPNKLSDDFISVAVYPQDYFDRFSPQREFVRYAAVEVTAAANILPDLEILIIPVGLYAVFNYKGKSTDNSIYRYIYETWLPTSGYVLDNRPHFEVLGKGYRNNSDDSEEQIWIPVRSTNK